MPAVPAVSCSVIIPAYTMDRWDLMVESVEGVAAQTLLPAELVLCIDHNPDLYARCQEKWPEGSLSILFHLIENFFEHDDRDLDEHAKAHGTRRRFGAGTARNSAATLCTGDVLAFIDDDAVPDPDWLVTLLQPYADPNIVAVGGAPLPRYQTRRPRWFPANFDWIFGCAYAGLPETTGPLAHLIGANLSVRRNAFEKLGGFQSIDFDDLDLCMRLGDSYPASAIVYEPAAIVRHYVPAERVSWSYFWRRPYFVNRSKVEAFRNMGTAANLRAEREFVAKAMTRQLGKEFQALRSGDLFALTRVFAMIVGVGGAAIGNAAGRVQARRSS